MDTEVLIVGAGPYGLGIAQALHERGVDFAVVGEPFELWLEHTLSGMRLRSDHNASEIYSGDGRYGVRAFLAREGRETDGRDLDVTAFRRYLDDVARRLPFGVERSRVSRLARSNGHFRAELAGGSRLEARSVVVATGVGSHRHVPAALRGLGAETLLHSWETRRIEDLAGGRVLVVGSGQSAAESVEALRGRCRVTWALRHEPFFCREPLRLPTPLFKLLLRFSAAYYRLPYPLRRALSRAIFQTTITPRLREVYLDDEVRKVRADAEGLGLEAAPGGVGSRLTGERYDAVVAATGFRCTLGGLPFLAEPLRRELGDAGAAPYLDRDFQSRVPRLFMAGALAEGAYGPAQRFILGSWRAARQIGRAAAGIAARDS